MWKSTYLCWVTAIWLESLEKLLFHTIGKWNRKQQLVYSSLVTWATIISIWFKIDFIFFCRFRSVVVFMIHVWMLKRLGNNNNFICKITIFVLTKCQQANNHFQYKIYSIGWMKHMSRFLSFISIQAHRNINFINFLSSLLEIRCHLILYSCWWWFFISVRCAMFDFVTVITCETCELQMITL